MAQLIIVSNRLPVTIEKKGNKHEVRQSSGGLVSALQGLSSDKSAISWLGVADFKKEVWQSIDKASINSKFIIEPLFVDKGLYDLYYDKFSNTVIWPLFHYFPSYAEYHDVSFEAFKEVNKIFADKIIGTAKRGDEIWIHDYHLMLLPRLIKEKRPDLKVGFFLHIPFPSYEIIKLIPTGWRNDILEGLVSADVLGFHTKEYLSHFKRCLAYFSSITVNNDKVEVNGKTCLMKQYPISIDYQNFNEAFDTAPVVRGRNSILQKHDHQKIIFSVDRLDYTKGVINRLQAFELLLESNPECREKIVFVINVVPSRDQITKYTERKKMIEENIGRINGLYGSVSWQPVIYQYRHLTFAQLLSFYTAADIALITPLRDGMNLVAKEFVASRKDKRGVLILSEFAGAASELHEAILVNPNDVISMKDGILKALSLDEEEQHARIESMQRVLQINDIYKWTSSFINDLKKSATTEFMRQPHVMTLEERTTLIEAYRQSKKRLLLLDYDGTLVPYYTKPSEAEPGKHLIELLHSLCSEPENEVIIISGRDSPSLDKWFSDTGISVVAEHGSLYKKNGSSWVNLAGNAVWKNEVETLFESNALLYKDSFVEKKSFSIAFHYRQVDSKKTDELKTLLTRELLMLDTNNEFDVIHGNMVVEARSFGINKGTFVSRLIQENKYDFILAMGDDTTDEDMFNSLSDTNQYTVKIGITPTNAKSNLINVNSAISFLEQLKSYKKFKAKKPDLQQDNLPSRNDI